MKLTDLELAQARERRRLYQEELEWLRTRAEVRETPDLNADSRYPGNYGLAIGAYQSGSLKRLPDAATFRPKTWLGRREHQSAIEAYTDAIGRLDATILREEQHREVERRIDELRRQMREEGLPA